MLSFYHLFALCDQNSVSAKSTEWQTLSGSRGPAAIHQVQSPAEGRDTKYNVVLVPCRALVSVITSLPKTSDVVLWIYKLIFKQLCCLVCPGLWLNEAHRKPVSCMNGNRRGRYRYLKQLSIYSRRHPSDKMIKRSAFQTMTPIGQQRCRVWALV